MLGVNFQWLFSFKLILLSLRETSKFDQKQTLLNLEIKIEEENRLKDVLSQKRKENMKVSLALLKKIS